MLSSPNIQNFVFGMKTIIHQSMEVMDNIMAYNDNIKFKFIQVHSSSSKTNDFYNK